MRMILGAGQTGRGWAVALMATWIAAPFAAAQGLRTDNVTTSLNRTLTSGRLLGRPQGSSAPQQPRSASGTGFQRRDEPAARFGGRGGGGAPGYGGTTSFSQMSRTHMMVPFGSSLARGFAPPAYSGYGRYSPPIGPAYTDDSTISILNHNYRIIAESTYHARLFQDLQGGSVRDELTNTTLDNPYAYTELDLSAPRKSHAQIVSERMHALSDRNIELGWTYVREGKEILALDAFESALLVRPGDFDAQLGRMLAAALNEQYTAAVAYFRSLHTHHDELLSARRPFADTFVETKATEPRRGEMLLRQFSRTVDQNPSDEAYAALHAYLLWLDDQRSLARSIADKLQRNHPQSPFADLAERMRSEDEAGELTEEPPADEIDFGKLPKLRALSQGYLP